MSNPRRNRKFKDFDGTLSSFNRFSPLNLLWEATPLVRRISRSTKQFCEMLSDTLPKCGDKSRRPARSWWTPSAAIARNRSRFWHRLWVSCGRPADAAVADCYREARRSYRRARRKAAVSHIEQEARLLRLLCRDRKLTAFWRRVQLARRGGLPTSSSCCAADFGAHFQAVHRDSREQLSEEQQLIADAVQAQVMAARTVVSHRTVSSEDVAGLLHRLHTGKAPGVDGVTSEHLLFGSTPTLLCALARLLTGCLSSNAVPSSFTESAVVPLLKSSQLDPNCLDNYRPISITTCVSKLLELLILDELHSSFRPHDLQFGFILKRGTTEASLLVGETIQRNRRMGLPVFAANLDARKCFDRIWHDGLFYRLMQHLTLARFPYFATFASGGGGGGGVGTTPPGDRPLMVVELRGKNQSTRLDEISRLHIFF